MANADNGDWVVEQRMC